MAADQSPPIRTRRIAAWQCIRCGELAQQSLPPVSCARCGIRYTIDNHVAYGHTPEPEPELTDEAPGDAHYLWLVAAAGIAAAGVVVGLLIVIAIVITAWRNAS